MDKSIKKEIGKNITGGIKNIPAAGWLIILLILLVCLFLYSLNFRINAQTAGETLGETSGTLTGRAVGSLEGLTTGQMKGFKKGKEEAQKAKDTTAELAGKIEEVEKLEVLVASGTYSDVLSIGEESNIQYAALLSQKYNAVFTVDLATADISPKNNELYILLDLPKVEFVPVGEVVKINEYQKPGFVFDTGSTEDGWKSALNSMEQMTKKAREKLQTNESLMNAAKNAAKSQLTQFVYSVSLSQPNIVIEFREVTNNE